MNKIRNVAIAGAGIGGLTVALGLAYKRINVTVFEQTSVLIEVGAGLQISPNAMRVLRKFDLEEALRPYAFVPQQATIRNFKSGKYYLKTPLGKTAEIRYGAPYWHLHRADLHRVLVAACKNAGVVIHLGVDVTGYQMSEKYREVHLLLGDGSRHETDLIIGADGIHSVIRDQMHGKKKPTFMGQVAWRGVIPIDQLNTVNIQPDACIWVGPGRHLVTYCIRNGKLVNFVAVEECSDWRSKSWWKKGDVHELRAAFSGWHSQVTELLSAADSTFLWALNGYSSLANWYQGQVALLGDACNPMLPFMAQGAAMAIEDAYVLTESVVNDTLYDALSCYEILRKSRATSIQQMSKENAALYHMHGGAFGRMKLNIVRMASKFAPSVIQSKLDFVYGYDVIKAMSS